MPKMTDKIVLENFTLKYLRTKSSHVGLDIVLNKNTKCKLPGSNIYTERSFFIFHFQAKVFRRKTFAWNSFFISISWQEAG
ncbi:MAG: hypothetical protein B6247_10040 [Candidatus Parabeggiatoa sp. nov. 2]|nr:MAG: hypothetical protein B6247_10040 [Beggiatoa sp. 4572_84]